MKFKFRMENFIKVNKNILQAKDSKYIATMVMLNQYINRNNECVFSIEKLIKDCGYIPKTGKGKNVEQFKYIIKYLIDNNILEDCNIKDVDNLKTNIAIYCTYSPKFDIKDNKDINFISLPVGLLNKIIFISDRNRCDLIFLMLYFMSFMNKLDKYCYPSIDNIKESTGFSKNKILKLIDILKESNLIYVDNIGLCSRNGEFNTFNNVYALDTCALNSGLMVTRAYAVSQGYKPLNKRQKKLVQQINGIKGVIKREHNKGKDVSKSEEKLKELKNKLNDKCDISIDELNKKIEVLNKECDRLGIDRIEPTDTFDINELIEIKEFLEDSIKRSHKELKELFK